MKAFRMPSGSPSYWLLQAKKETWPQLCWGSLHFLTDWWLINDYYDSDDDDDDDDDDDGDGDVDVDVDVDDDWWLMTDDMMIWCIWWIWWIWY